VETNPELKESKLRKWIIYFTLFVTGTTIAVDAIVLVNTFLGGEDFATGFVLKVLSVFAVAGAIFTFCLKDLKGYFDGNPKQSKFWSIVVSVIVLLSVIGGFVLIGSPSAQRSKIYDNQRISDLQSIQWQVTNYYQQKGKLPESLNDLKDPLSGQVIPVDPKSKEDYWYYITNEKGLNFDICATFETDNTKDTKIEYYDHELWTHGATQVCYNRTIDPDKYPRVK
jgi:type II secretory pathway pseudopilin PulG